MDRLNITFTTESASTIYTDALNTAHILIAGTTGSGKSVLMRGIMNEIISKYTPQECAYVLCDPKRVEFMEYDIPGYCIGRYTSAEHIESALNQICQFMERRYALMEKEHLRSWNPSLGQRVYVFIDELADLMISDYEKPIKKHIQKLTQLGRAADIHVVVATQCPNRKTIPAEITLNFTTRIALRCISAIESRQIVQVNGAEKLPRYGKALRLNETGINHVDVPFIDDNMIMKTIRSRCKAS